MFKTILVPVDGSASQSSRLRAAAQLADSHGGHLVGSAMTGVSWPDFALLAGSMGGPVPQDDFDALRDAAAARLEAFKREAHRLGVESVEARLIEDEPRYALLVQSRYADLLVVSQDREPDPGTVAPVRGLPEHLVLYGTRPVLVVPATYDGRPLSGTVVVGWDGGMQAIRAIQAALPLLRGAAQVKLALVNPDAIAGLHGDEPGADMALYLARHGIEVEVVIERTGTGAGQALAGLARDCGAGLLVTGAYGHNRLREWALGGATRELLAHAPVPLLLAH